MLRTIELALDAETPSKDRPEVHAACHMPYNNPVSHNKTRQREARRDCESCRDPRTLLEWFLYQSVLLSFFLPLSGLRENERERERDVRRDGMREKDTEEGGL